MNIRLVLDLSIIFDFYSERRREKYPKSVEVLEKLNAMSEPQVYICSASLDKLYWVKLHELQTQQNDLTDEQIEMVVSAFISELTCNYQMAKTPSYIQLDHKHIEDSQLLASAEAVGGLLLTRNERILEQYPELSLSVNACLELLEQPPKVPFLDLKKQYFRLQPKIEKQCDQVLNNTSFIMGSKVVELEDKLAQYVGVKHAITCANGTDALQLCLMALGIKAGDAVFCPTFTFFATAEVIAFADATPVFVDSDENTFNICTVDLEKRIKQTIEEGKVLPKAIIAVDLFGLPANYPEIERIAKQYNLVVIEDAAQGFGGEINGKKAGSFGDIATTSFFPAKPLGCYGDGGAIFTDNDELAELIRSYRVHGKGQDKYDNIRIGVNSRLDTLQAAILLEKLADFPQELINRNKGAANYEAELAGVYKTPKVPAGYLSAWAQYTLVAQNRDEVMAQYKAKGIPTVIYYEKCLHMQTAFKYLGYQANDFPIALKLSQQVFSLPCPCV